MDLKRNDQSRSLAPIFSKKKPKMTLLAHPKNTISRNDALPRAYSVSSRSTPGSNMGQMGSTSASSRFTNRTASGDQCHQYGMMNQTSLASDLQTPTWKPQPQHGQYQPQHQWQQPHQLPQSQWQPHQNQWQPQQQQLQQQPMPWQPPENAWQDSHREAPQGQWTNQDPIRYPNLLQQHTVPAMQQPWQQGSAYQQPSSNHDVTPRTSLKFNNGPDWFNSPNSSASTCRSLQTVGPAWKSSEYGTAVYTPSTVPTPQPWPSTTPARAPSPNIPQPSTSLPTPSADKPLAAEPREKSDEAEVQTEKHRCDTSLRILAATVQGMKHWSSQKHKLALLFELIGRVNSAVSPAYNNTAKEFVLKDDKDHSITCIFYEVDRPMPRLVRGQYYRCIGSLESSGNNANRLRCISIRPAREQERKLHPVQIAAADKTMRAVIFQAREM